MTTMSRKPEDVAWYSLSAEDATRRLSVVPAQGLSPAQTARLLHEYGPNEMPKEPPQSRRAVARGQLRTPMSLMLLIVGAASIAIRQIPTAIVVLALVTCNVVMGTNQEMKARASVDALAQLQVPKARVRRSGEVLEI